MGKANLSLNTILTRKEVFADFMNGTLYGGQQVLKAEDLERIPTHSGIFYETEEGKKNALERQGDVRMKADLGTYSVILASEPQNKVHYAMPVRGMLYDALEYTKQVQELENQHKKKGEKLEGSQFLSGITREDRLTPVVTTVLYAGPDWDGAKSLYEMMETGEDGSMEELRKFLPDYKLNLIDVNKIEDTHVFKSCLQHIFSMAKLRKDKKGLYKYMEDHREALERFDSVERNAALMLLGEQKRMARYLNKMEEKGEDRTMSEEFRDVFEESWFEGQLEGENRMAELVRLLLADKRQEDLERASTDSHYRLQMFEAYGI